MLSMQTSDSSLMPGGDFHNVVDYRSVSSSNPPPEEATPDEQETDALFAQELNKLSMEERDIMLQDIHGVSDVFDENPEFVARCMQALEREVSLIPSSEKVAYARARQQNESYVTSEKFLLMFLRSSDFNAKNAALRMISFFQVKLELFGIESLGREITLNDLDQDDRRVLESGYAQVLPGRDRAGRAVYFLLPLIKSHRTIENKLRCVFVVLMHALKDPETQRRGIVGIAYNVGRDHTKDREAVWKNAKLLSALPLNFKGVHYCYDDKKIRTLFNLAMFVFEKHMRIRCRLHFGTDMECVYTLMTFGIPSDVLPVSPSGELKLEGHEEYIRRLRKSEELNDGVERIILPGTGDVLLGRGKPLQKHPGNLRYHHVIGIHKERYDKASKLEKTTISKEIVQLLKECGSRFLKQDAVGWVEIGDEAARYKVSHTFRNHRIAVRVAEKKAAEATATPANKSTSYNRRKHDDSDASLSGDISDCGSMASKNSDGGKRRKIAPKNGEEAPSPLSSPIREEDESSL